MQQTSPVVPIHNWLPFYVQCQRPYIVIHYTSIDFLAVIHNKMQQRDPHSHILSSHMQCKSLTSLSTIPSIYRYSKRTLTAIYSLMCSTRDLMSLTTTSVLYIDLSVVILYQLQSVAGSRKNAIQEASQSLELLSVQTSTATIQKEPSGKQAFF